MYDFLFISSLVSQYRQNCYRNYFKRAWGMKQLEKLNGIGIWSL